jgi:DNA-binding GntR family transcriptional regulator
MAELPESPAQSIREHEAIIAAIRAGDAETAARAAER